MFVHMLQLAQEVRDAALPLAVAEAAAKELAT
jgi:hypothetical protein